MIFKNVSKIIMCSYKLIKQKYNKEFDNDNNQLMMMVIELINKFAELNDSENIKQNEKIVFFMFYEWRKCIITYIIKTVYSLNKIVNYLKSISDSNYHDNIGIVCDKVHMTQIKIFHVIKYNVNDKDTNKEIKTKNILELKKFPFTIEDYYKLIKTKLCSNELSGNYKYNLYDSILKKIYINSYNHSVKMIDDLNVQFCNESYQLVKMRMCVFLDSVFNNITNIIKIIYDILLTLKIISHYDVIYGIMNDIINSLNDNVPTDFKVKVMQPYIFFLENNKLININHNFESIILENQYDSYENEYIESSELSKIYTLENDIMRELYLYNNKHKNNTLTFVQIKGSLYEKSCFVYVSQKHDFVYLWKDIPYVHLKHIRLNENIEYSEEYVLGNSNVNPEKDIGCDIVGYDTANNTYTMYQCKDYASTIHVNDISGMTFRGFNNSNHVWYLIFSSCIGKNVRLQKNIKLIKHTMSGNIDDIIRYLDANININKHNNNVTITVQQDGEKYKVKIRKDNVKIDDKNYITHDNNLYLHALMKIKLLSLTNNLLSCNLLNFKVTHEDIYVDLIVYQN